jgi:hypothetical protein
MPTSIADLERDCVGLTPLHPQHGCSDRRGYMQRLHGLLAGLALALSAEQVLMGLTPGVEHRCIDQGNGLHFPMTTNPIALKLTPGGASAWPKLRARVATAAQTPLWGIVLIVASTVFFSCSDVLTKQLASSLPAVEIAWLRYVTFSLVVIPMLLLNGDAMALRSRRPGLQVLRGLGMAASALLFTTSLRFLPVADATAINFISPILICWAPPAGQALPL